MLLKYAVLNFLLLICALMVPVDLSSNYRHHFCPHCEEEAWEEVPCDQISRRSTATITTTESPKLPTYASSTQMPHTTEHPYTRRTPTQAPVAYSKTTVPSVESTTSSSYQSCYCECKVCCKEFCRKVAVNGTSQKYITQITKTSHPVPNGQLNSEHVHQYRFVPDPYVPQSAKPTYSEGIHPTELTNDLENSYGYPKLDYKDQPSVPNQPTSYSQTGQMPFTYEDSKLDNAYSAALLDSRYSVNDLSRILKMESLKDGSNTFYQPNVYGSYGPAPFYPSPPPASSYSNSAPITKPSNENNSFGPRYNVPILIPVCSAPSPMPSPSLGPQCANYFNKDSSSHPCHHEAAQSLSPNSNNDQKSSSSLNHHAPYYNPSKDYSNSIIYGIYTYAIPMSANYVPNPQPYKMQDR